MVPMNMGKEEEYIHPFLLGKQMLTQGPDACSGVNYHLPAAFKGNFKTGGVPPVDRSILSGNRNRTPRSPKFALHNVPF